MTQEEIIEILEDSQNEFIGINESNLHSADILVSKFEIEKLKFTKTELEKFRSKLGGYDILSGLLKQEIEIQIYEIEKQLKKLEK